MRGEPDAAQKIVDMLQGGARHSANTRFNARKAIRRHRIIKHVSAYIPGYTGFWDDDDEGDMGNMRGFADYVSEELGEKQKLKQMTQIERGLTGSLECLANPDSSGAFLELMQMALGFGAPGANHHHEHEFDDCGDDFEDDYDYDDDDMYEDMEDEDGDGEQEETGQAATSTR